VGYLGGEKKRGWFVTLAKGRCRWVPGNDVNPSKSVISSYVRGLGWSPFGLLVVMAMPSMCSSNLPGEHLDTPAMGGFADARWVLPAMPVAASIFSALVSRTTIEFRSPRAMKMAGCPLLRAAATVSVWARAVMAVGCFATGSPRAVRNVTRCAGTTAC